jgi:hypothetical protein
VVAEPDHRDQRLVSLRQPAEVGQRLRLGERGRQVERLVQPDGGRHRLGDEGLGRVQPERGQHLVALVGHRADVSLGEGVGGGRQAVGGSHS